MGFERAIVEATRIANEMEIEPIFYVKPKRTRKIKIHYDEKNRGLLSKHIDRFF